MPPGASPSPDPQLWEADLESLADDSPLWRELSVSSEQCTGRACAEYERCFVTQMRRGAEAAPTLQPGGGVDLMDLLRRLIGQGRNVRAPGGAPQG